MLDAYHGMEPVACAMECWTSNSGGILVPALDEVSACAHPKINAHKVLASHPGPKCCSRRRRLDLTCRELAGGRLRRETKDASTLVKIP